MALRVLCACGDRVEVPHECCMNSAYLLGIMDSLGGPAGPLRAASTASTPDAGTCAPVTIAAPLGADALRAVVRIMQGEQPRVVFEWGHESVTALLRQPASDALQGANASKLEMVVNALMAASYLSAPAAENSIGQHVAAVIRETCTSGRDLRCACRLHRDLSLSPDDAAYVERLLGDAGLNDLNISPRDESDNFPESPPQPWPAWPVWWQRPHEEPPGISTKAGIGNGWWTGSECTPHGALCLAGLPAFNSDSPLRFVSEDVLLELVRRVGSVLVPDEVSLPEAVASIDYKICGRRVLIRKGLYHLDAPLRVPDGRAVVIQPLCEGEVKLVTEHDTLLQVGQVAPNSDELPEASQQRAAHVQMRHDESTGTSSSATPACPWSSVLLADLVLSLNYRGSGGGDDSGDTAGTLSGSAEPETGSDHSSAVAGYWAGGPVVVRVGTNASALMIRCSVMSKHGTGMLVQGASPGHLPYIVEEVSGNEFACAGGEGVSDESGRAGATEAMDVKGGGLLSPLSQCGGLLPYGSTQLVEPRWSMRRACAVVVGCDIGPCRGETATGLVAGMQGFMSVRASSVHDIGLDGIGGRMEVLGTTLERCGESAVVASGISTYELCRSYLRPAAHQAPCPRPPRGEGGAGDNDATREGGTCGKCAAAGRLVERSLTSVDGCVVRECGEEGFWACESALLRWSDCQATDCGDGFAREVTGGVVQQHSALGREGAS